MEKREPKNIIEFAAALGVNLYKWQAEILLTVEAAATLTRKQVTVCGPNGIGKSARIVTMSALRWLQRFPRGKVVIVSYDSRQISDQVWPALRAHSTKFPHWKFTESQHTVDSSEGGRIRAFTTDDPGRAEGFHADEGCPLLIIVDEAKSVAKEIIQAIDRCSYNVLMYISSPWLKQGPFYESFTLHRESFIPFQIGLTDCPHISQEKIDDIKDKYGPDDPFTRSTLYGEFMSYGEGVNHILELPDVETWQSSLIDFRQGPTVFGCDFAAGGDDNVIVKRVGNAVKQIARWKDKNTASAAGEFVRRLRGMGYKSGMHMSVWGDCVGVGRVMCDLIRQGGIPILDFNAGAHSKDEVYLNEGTRTWYKVAGDIRSNKIVCPDRYHETTKILVAQLLNRRIKTHSGGKLWMETKQEMASRGVKSPDVADAFCIAFGVTQALAWSYVPYDDSGRQEIARSHGWDYTVENDDYAPASWGITEHPTKDELKGGGRDYEGSSMGSYVNFDW
jgi:phage terminase large subunit